MKQKRLKPAVRKQEIISAALHLARRCGYMAITRNQIAAAAGISGPAVQYHFETMAQLRRAIMRAAVKQECLPVILQGLALKDAQAMKASESMRKAAFCFGCSQ